MPTQTQSGKAFEYAFLQESKNLLQQNNCELRIDEDAALFVAKSCYELFSKDIQDKYDKAAKTAIQHILKLEPRITTSLTTTDVLILQIVTDAAGMEGDVRDVLFLRSFQKWEIGVSVKNNHKAVKHSRLSDKIDFGKKWVGVKCSEKYFQTVNPVFEELRELKKERALWRNLTDKQERFYMPILNAFKIELECLDRENEGVVPKNLLSYLIGKKDFYKIIKQSRTTEIYGFHLYGTLNKTAPKNKPQIKVPRLKLPTKIIDISFKTNSKDTLILTCDEGWQISFRIHNASSKVEPSLKFDINLVGQPPILYSHHLTWG